jgi:putative transposase
VTREGERFGVSVSSVCRKLGLTRQNYYRRRQARRRGEVDAEQVRKWVVEERQAQPRLGGRKLYWLIRGRLAEAGIKLGRDLFFDLLRGWDLLVPRKPAAVPRTTQSYHCLPVFTNRIKDLKVSRPNEVWVGDLTYLRTEQGFLYLALLTDKRSRKIVGYHCGDTLEAEGCLKALDQALAGLPPGAQPIHHSDRGTQYCCHEYVNRLVEHGLSVSMTEHDHCAENALAERVNGILKGEYALDARFGCKASARRAVDQAVHLYNYRRPHTALAMQMPSDVHALAA